MKYGNLSLQRAVEEVMKEMPPDGGGVIAVDAHGNVSMEFNCSGFFRAFAKSTGEESFDVW